MRLCALDAFGVICASANAKEKIQIVRPDSRLDAIVQKGAALKRVAEGIEQPGFSTAAFWRRAGRVFCVLFFSGIALLEMGLRFPLVDGTGRANWLHRWCRFACWVLGLRLTIKGSMPKSGLLVCNHLSYLDIIALASLRRCIFVAKRDVYDWPLFGWLARAAGTIFVRRDSRAAAVSGLAQIQTAIDSGLLVVLFPEGTSSDGATVLPFKSSLLQAAVAARCPIAAAGIDYQLEEGSVADEVCYW